MARLPREKLARGREGEGGSTSERDVMVREEERATLTRGRKRKGSSGRETRRMCVEHACVGEGRRELDEERRLANERDRRDLPEGG